MYGKWLGIGWGIRPMCSKPGHFWQGPFFLHALEGNPWPERFPNQSAYIVPRVFFHRIASPRVKKNRIAPPCGL